MERVQKRGKKKVALKSRKNESRKLLKCCFRNVLFSLVPLDIWIGIVSNSDIHSILLIAQTCYAFKELLDNIGENNFNLALLFRREGQIDLAKKYLLLCANNNNPIAMFHVGFSYSGDGGWGLEQDHKKSAEWLKRSAELGNEAAMAYYSRLSIVGDGVEENEELGEFWAKRALSSNDSVAVGYCHYYGYGTERDYDKAVKFFESAANEGNEFGQYWLGTCLFYGEGVEEDRTRALQWYLKSANQGNSRSQADVAAIYAYGLGVKRKDKQKAIIWYKKAAKQGNSSSKDELVRIGADKK